MSTTPVFGSRTPPRIPVDQILHSRYDYFVRTFTSGVHWAVDGGPERRGIDGF
jgi:hypothetical protein